MCLSSVAGGKCLAGKTTSNKLEGLGDDGGRLGVYPEKKSDKRVESQLLKREIVQSSFNEHHAGCSIADAIKRC